MATNVSSDSPVHLVWLRNDLRVADNPALFTACLNKTARVIALFIATPGQWRQHAMAPRQAEFIRQHLVLLRASLAEKGIPLYLHEVDDFAACSEFLSDFCNEHQVSHLFYNKQYEVNEQQRDDCVTRNLAGKVICQGFDGSVLLPPGSVVTGNREMFKVFTPFCKAFLRRLRESVPQCVSAPAARGEPIIPAGDIPFSYPVEQVDAVLFPCGEKAAIARLREFCQQRAQDYSGQRDYPAINGTSMLSPYLAIGVLSPGQCLNRLLVEYPQALDNDGSGAAVWLNELIWREFYRHLLVAWPGLCRYQPFVSWTDRVPWSRDESRLIAWQRGQTGYPIVDAAMRQLNTTGWMHNRLRMIVASFLTKDLLIDWRAGEQWFMSQLLDGDLAANNGGWQWAASTGTDAAPYFRIFNPETQSNRFDPQGHFIRQWIPALHHVPDNAIHAPWQWADKQNISLDYPRPLVDHKVARLTTLAAWEQAREGVTKGT